MNWFVYFNQATIQRRPKNINQAMYLILGSSQIRSLAWGIVPVSALILFIEATQVMAAIQTRMTIKIKKKYRTGTRTILLVAFRKSAEASMTSIASLRDEK